MLLERLVFSCENHSKDFEKEIKLRELEQLIFHPEKCDNKVIIPFKNCKNCQSYIRKDKVHNCLLKFSVYIDQKMNQLIEMFNKKIDNIEKSCNLNLEQQRISFQSNF